MISKLTGEGEEEEEVKKTSAIFTSDGQKGGQGVGSNFWVGHIQMMSGS